MQHQRADAAGRYPVGIFAAVLAEGGASEPWRVPRLPDGLPTPRPPGAGSFSYSLAVSFRGHERAPVPGQRHWRALDPANPVQHALHQLRSVQDDAILAAGHGGTVCDDWKQLQRAMELGVKALEGSTDMDEETRAAIAEATKSAVAEKVAAEVRHDRGDDRASQHVDVHLGVAGELDRSAIAWVVHRGAPSGNKKTGRRSNHLRRDGRPTARWNRACGCCLSPQSYDARRASVNVGDESSSPGGSALL